MGSFLLKPAGQVVLEAGEGRRRGLALQGIRIPSSAVRELVGTDQDLAVEMLRHLQISPRPLARQTSVELARPTTDDRGAET